jgi:hypothetical protein
MDKKKVTESLRTDLEFCQNLLDLFHEFLGPGPLLPIQKDIDQIVPTSLQLRAKSIMDQRWKEHHPLPELNQTPEATHMHTLLHSFLKMAAKFIERSEDIHDPHEWAKNFQSLFHQTQKSIYALDKKYGTGSLHKAA